MVVGLLKSPIHLLEHIPQKLLPFPFEAHLVFMPIQMLYCFRGVCIMQLQIYY